MKNRPILRTLYFILGFASLASAQNDISYQTPPKAIADLVLAKPIPFVRIDSKAEYLLLLGRNSYPTVEELGQPEIKVAGLRINPLNFSLTRQTLINNIVIKSIKNQTEINISGLPKNLSVGSLVWNSSETKIAFTQVEKNRIDLYIIDLLLKKAYQINNSPLNQVLGTTFTWLDDQTIIYKVATHDPTKVPTKPVTPKGPTVQQNVGKAAPRPTFQDLIKSPYDENLFEFFAESQLISYKNGINKKIGTPSIINSFDVSPDKKFILLRTLSKPFSYAVPAYGFPSNIKVINLDGSIVKDIASLPSSENAPAGNDNVQNVPRGFEWRDDEPSTIVYAMPLDSGLIKKSMEFHDVVYSLSSPFNQAPKELFKTKMRFSDISWGDKNIALVTEISRAKQFTKVSKYRPSDGSIELLYERNLTDAYNNPGTPVRFKNNYGRNVIQLLDGGTKMLLNNQTGSSVKGDLPFLAKFDLVSKKNEIIWRSKEGYYEQIEEVIDPNKLIVLTRKESQKEVPNYYLKSLSNVTEEKVLTTFENPYKGLEGITKEKIKYKRADGVDLTGDLYLPKGYNKEKDGPLPVLIWAYPREFNSAADAAQVRGSKDKFTILSWATPIYYATQGYAILDNAEMPIVSTDPTKKPNDNFVEQLRLNASAAIDYLVNLGIGDKNRMAVGGHSYGAFMTANLLAHTDLFKAGIARSGAYNRTLTPFGFQNEDRTYWQAPQLYYEMSPFSFADKIKEPILLVHGEQDDNTGTYPINSERLYAALKGNGGTARFVYLPYEAHSYRGKENILHLLWEQFQWLEKYVK
jgi:dipeptidyl aminopeptidase/acylaminoacyl peptidase